MNLVIIGKKNTGKDTLVREFYKYFPDYSGIAFADPIKEFARDYLDIDSTLLWGDSALRETLTKFRWSDIDPYFQSKIIKTNLEFLTVREILQLVGSEMLGHLYKKIWVNKCLKSFKDKKIISDMRRNIEYECLRQLTGTIFIRIDRVGINHSNSHASETELDWLKLEDNNITDTLRMNEKGNPIHFHMINRNLQDLQENAKIIANLCKSTLLPSV